MEIKHSFLLSPNSLPLAQRLVAASLNWVNHDIKEKRFPEGKVRENEQEIFLVSFEQPLGYERVRERFLKEGYVPCTIYELIDFAAMKSDFYSEYPIYSVFKETELRYGGIVNAHPALKFSGSKKKIIKELSLPWYIAEWPPGTLFICYKQILP